MTRLTRSISRQVTPLSPMPTQRDMASAPKAAATRNKGKSWLEAVPLKASRAPLQTSTRLINRVKSIMMMSIAPLRDKLGLHRMPLPPKQSLSHPRLLAQLGHEEGRGHGSEGNGNQEAEASSQGADGFRGYQVHIYYTHVIQVIGHKKQEQGQGTTRIGENQGVDHCPHHILAYVKSGCKKPLKGQQRIGQLDLGNGRRDGHGHIHYGSQGADDNP